MKDRGLTGRGLARHGKARFFSGDREHGCRMLTNLTDAQRSAVESDARELLCIAGAGSGKTRVLIARIVHMITKCGASPSDILCLTFTRKAAAEVRGRLLAALAEAGHTNPEREVANMLLGTFHSVALRIIRRHGGLLGYNPDRLTIIDADDADMFLRQTCLDMGYLRADGKTWTHQLSWRKVEQARETRYTTGKLKAFKPVVAWEATLRILGRYRQQLFEFNALDFGSILLECKRLLLEQPRILGLYHGQIKHVLVDEIQDTDLIQYNLQGLFAPPATFFAVGDRRQSIYGFRGARPDLVTEQHPDAKIVDLQECFRCGDYIVEAANRLIDVNGDTLAKPMIGATGIDGAVTLFAGRSEDLVKRVIALKRAYGWADVAVLARNHRTLRRLADAFGDACVPARRVGAGFDICDGPLFHLLLSAMKIALNPRDNIAFMRLYTAFGLDAADYARVRQIAADLGSAHIAALTATPRMIGNEPLHAVIRWVWDHPDDTPAIDVVHALAQSLSQWASAEWSPVTEFWHTYCAELTLRQALTWYALRDAQDDIEQGDHVTLATVHAAKGLEWPVIIVAELNEGSLPSSQSIHDPDAMIEERRVAYVGCTRASERLVLHYREAEHQDPKRVTQPSRFLAECRVFEAEPMPV